MITYENAMMELNFPGSIGNQKKRRIAELLKKLHDDNADLTAENVRVKAAQAEKESQMSNNEKQYLENIARNRCGYWDVCDDHACGCAPDADVSQGFNEQVYERMRLEQLEETALEDGK